MFLQTCFLEQCVHLEVRTSAFLIHSIIQSISERLQSAWVKLQFDVNCFMDSSCDRKGAASSGIKQVEIVDINGSVHFHALIFFSQSRLVQ